MKLKYKKWLISIPVFLIVAYLSSALYSVHQIHKGIYYNDRTALKQYIEWNEVRENFKNYFNAQILKESQNNADLNELGELGIFFAGLASKVVDYAVDEYLNAESISMLLEINQNGKSIPEPNLSTLLGGLAIIKFKNINSFIITAETDSDSIPIIIERRGLSWKVVDIQFPHDFLEKITQ